MYGILQPLSPSGWRRFQQVSNSSSFVGQAGFLLLCWVFKIHCYFKLAPRVGHRCMYNSSPSLYNTGMSESLQYSDGIDVMQVGGYFAMNAAMPTMLGWVLGGNLGMLTDNSARPSCCHLNDKPNAFPESVRCGPFSTPHLACLS